MNKSPQYRVDLPLGQNVEQMRAWCKKNLNGGFKVTYHRKYNEKKKKWGRDYKKGIMLRFREEGDALAFKLIWLESNE